MTGSELTLFSYAIYRDKAILDEIKEDYLSPSGLETYRKIIQGEISDIIGSIPEISFDIPKEKIVEDVINDYIRRELLSVANYIRSDLKDPYDTLAKLELLIDSVKRNTERKVESYDIMKYLENFFDNNTRDYIPFGISKLDNFMYGILRGNLFTIGGDTGSMKTTFTLWLSSNWARKGYSVLFFEKEMPPDDVVRRLINMNCGIDNQSLLLGLYDRDNVEKELQKINKLKIVPSYDFNTVLDVYKIVEKHKPDIFVIDFITQLDFGGDTASDFNYNMMRSLNLLKILTHRTNSVGVIISQLKKGTIEQRSSKIARLDDLEWSAALKQLSAYVAMVFYPSLYYSNVDKDLFYLVFRKLRYGDLIFYPMSVDKELGIFSELPADRYERAKNLFYNL